MTRRTNKAAFTLVELLVAMAILAVIILMMAQIFTESTRAFDMGIALADQNLKGRMILDFMAREISQAVVDGTIAFALDSEDVELYGPAVEDADRLHFVTLSESTEGSTFYRQAREVVYFVDEMKDKNNEPTGRYQLRRKTRTDSISCYEKPSPHKWWEGFSDFEGKTLAENIAGFQVWCYAGPDTEAMYDFDSTKLVNVMEKGTSTKVGETINELPMWIEISLMMFDEDDAEMAANMYDFGKSDEAVRNFALKNARRYVTRINLVNRNGYAADK
ncbi:MAG: PilW family protein [Kiritimatiellia bacterium]